jgi:phenylalanyl-tRNA synthetase alpha subunit
LSDEEKKDFGKKMSEIKNTLTSAYAEKEKNLTTFEINKKLEKDIIDISVEAKTFEN